MRSLDNKETLSDEHLLKHVKRMIGAGSLAFVISLFSKEVASVPALWMLGELGYSYLLILRDGGVKGPLHSTRERQ